MSRILCAPRGPSSPMAKLQNQFGRALWKMLARKSFDIKELSEHLKNMGKFLKIISDIIVIFFSEDSEWNIDAATNAGMNKRLMENMDRNDITGKTKKRVHMI